MPQLPRNNKLDYNPDSTIQASKQLTTIGLKNMKNPLTNPDQSALSSLSSQKSLGATIDEFSKLLLGLQSSFIKAKIEAKRLVSVYLGRQQDRQSRQMNEMNEVNELQRQLQERLERQNMTQTTQQSDIDELQRQIQEERARYMRGEGRPRGSKNKPKVASQPSTLLQIEDVPARWFSAEPVGRYDVLPVADYSNRMISQGAVADAEVEDPDEPNTAQNTPSYNREDSESSSSRSSIRSSISSNWYNPRDTSSSSSSSSSSSRSRSRSNRYRYGGDGGDDGWDDGDGDDTNSSHYSNMGGPQQIIVDGNPHTILSSLILDITRQIRYMDLLVISKIKPSVQQLNTSQLNVLSQAYATLTKLWKEFSNITLNNDLGFSLVDYFKDVVSFGDQIIRILEEELNKLKIDLLIVVNSYKQNEAIQSPNFTPDSFWENSAVREMEGGGRTFTGRNHSGRDIPTIWRGAMRECAYKYML